MKGRDDFVTHEACLAARRLGLRATVSWCFGVEFASYWWSAASNFAAPVGDCRTAFLDHTFS